MREKVNKRESFTYVLMSPSGCGAFIPSESFLILTDHTAHLGVVNDAFQGIHTVLTLKGEVQNHKLYGM